MPLKDWQLALLYGGGIIGALGVITVVVSDLFGPGPVGGSCTQPGTPCYAAIKGFIDAETICVNELAQAYQTYLAEDNVNGTGFTSQQLGNLAALQQCIDHNSQQAALAAKQYEPLQVLGVLQTIGEVAVVGALTIIGANRFFQTLRTTPRTGGTIASTVGNATIQSEVNAGRISAATAGALQTDVNTLVTEQTAADQASLNTLADELAITLEEADVTFSEDTTAMADDATVTENALAGV